jgi:hypothetical protein
MPKLWSNLNGMVACEKHMGHYAESALMERPKARKLETRLDVWRPLPRGEHRAPWAACESCGVRMKAAS